MTSIVLGADNLVIGNRIWSNTNNTKIVGKDVWAFDSKAAGVPVVGRDVVRVDFFDIHLSKTDEIKTHPEEAIKYLLD